MRAEAGIGRGGGAFDVCVGFDAPVAADAVADSAAGFVSGFLLLACAAVEVATVAAACFTSGTSGAGLRSAISFGGSDLVGILGVFFVAVVFTALGSRSMVVGLGVSCVALPADLELDGLVLAPDALDLAPVPEPSGLEVDVAAALGVRDRVDLEDPVDRDFEVGRCGDFTILLSLLRCFWMEETIFLPTPTRYIRQI